MHRCQPLYLLFLFTLFHRFVDGFDYCSLHCLVNSEIVKHTVCQYEKGGGSECSNWTSPKMTTDIIRELEDHHNKLRNTVAQDISFGPFLGKPMASDMMKLSWCDDLMVTAQRWADQCAQIGPDRCRLTTENKNTSQIRIFGNAFIPDIRGLTPKVVIDNIFRIFRHNLTSLLNSADWDQSDAPKFRKNPTINNFANILVSKTDRFGCGFSWKILHKPSEFSYQYRLVCNYYPTIKEQDPLFKVGKRCTSCPSGTRCDNNSKFENLCTPQSLLLNLSSVTVIDPVEDYTRKYVKGHIKSDGFFTASDVKTLILSLICVFSLVLLISQCN